jgi:hypothetical protein
MVYQNPIYGIFNQSYIEAQMRQRHHNDQVMKSIECANKLREFLESADEVEEDYQPMALDACCGVLAEYINKHRFQ